MERIHFVGVAGSGMSALAQYQAMRGADVSGSDRAFDRAERPAVRAALERLGVRVHAQDGSGVDGGCTVVVSTAVEDSVPDAARARETGATLLHRSELLARLVVERRTVAVAGTSGKSTVVAMVFEVLRAAGRDPSVITGGEILSLVRQGLLGNAFAGAGDALVVEADESDGSLVRYEPAVGVVTNVSRDHQEVEETIALLRIFRSRAREAFVVPEADALRDLAVGAITFGFGAGASVRADDVRLGPDGSRFVVGGRTFSLPVPGRHEVENALAAVAACGALGVGLDVAAEALGRFEGVARRFRVVGRARGVEVVDDYAHNPDKIRAAIATARLRGPRVLAVWQPHGFGPTRFLWDDLVRAFAEALGADDRLLLLDVFYAGGTARRDVSSEDLAAAVRAAGRDARAVERSALVETAAAQARAGDVVLVMGARDASLSDLARGILARLER